MMLFSTASFGAGEFYCCQDSSSGRRICGDTLPEQCRGHAYRLLDSAGNMIKEVGPPLTPEQKAEKAADDKRRKQQEEIAREQRRKDQALLDTYTTPQDIDYAQKQAEGDINLAMQETQGRIAEAQKKRLKLADEAEFYKKKAMPPSLAKDLTAIDHEIRVQQELLDVKKHEMDSVKAKYDADRKRYFELTGRAPRAMPSGTAQ